MKQFFTLLICVLATVIARSQTTETPVRYTEDAIYYDVYADHAVVAGYDYYQQDRLENVIVPESVTVEGATYPVTEIGCRAFGESGVRVVELPASVTVIGEEAFFVAVQLEDIIMPGVEEIGDHAFRRSGLATITLPATLKKIGLAPFIECDNLTAINVDEANPDFTSYDGVLFNKDRTTLLSYPVGKEVEQYFKVIYTVTKIGDEAFASSKLEEIYVPNELVEIGERAFQDCNQLKFFPCPDGLKIIGEEAFMGCAKLEYVNIYAGVESIGEGAYAGCTGLRAINVKGDNPYYMSEGGILYDKNQTVILAYPPTLTATEFTIPSTVTKIGNATFSACRNLQQINLPAGLVEIGDKAFSQCVITSYTFPETLSTIGKGAFLYNSQITELTLPASVKNIGDEAFASCSKLQRVILPEGLTCIAPNTFRFCSKLVDVNLPATIEEIGKEAFYYCRNLTSIIFPESLKTIGDRAFHSSDLSYLDFPSGLETIGESAFSFCKNIQQVRFGADSALKTIGGSAFSNCNKLQLVDLPSSLEDIGTYAFGGCGQLTSAYLDKTAITLLPSSIFSGCYLLEDVTLPETLTEIGYHAFSGCLSLDNIIIPSGVTRIGYWAFFNCRKLSSILIPAKVMYIGSGVFSSCSALEAIDVEEGNTAYQSLDGVLLTKDGTTLINYPMGNPATAYEVPSGVKTISENAFRLAQSLETITLPEGLESIEAYAFSCCYAISAIDLPATLKNIEKQAFSECDELRDVRYLTTSPIEGESNIFSDATYSTGVLTVATGGLENARTTEPWSLFTEIVEQDIETSVEEIESVEETKTATIHDLNGRKVTNSANLPAGVYIKSAGGKTRKVIVK